MHRILAVTVAALACLSFAGREAVRAQPPPPRPGDRQASAAPSDPRFEWFAYEGHDPVYDAFPERAGEYRNPILAGFYPDPSIARVEDDYYLVNSSFSYYPGVPIFHSRDLVRWSQIGHVFDRPSQIGLDRLGISRGIFAPDLTYHAGTFYLVTTLADGGGNFVVTASNPAGPWSDPVWLRDIDGIDPSLFFDEDGRAYLLNNGPPPEAPRYDGHRAIWLQEFDLTAKKPVGERTVLVNGGVDLAKKPIWIEGPHIFRKDGKYYLIAAEGGTADQHSEVVFRSDGVRGPYLPYAGNPILTQRHLDPMRPHPVTSTGHADFVETPRGEWWAVFLGTRPYDDDRYNTGRETFLMPVRWVDGWPVIAAGGETVPYRAKSPNLPAAPAPKIPMNGNFELRDEFTSTELAPYWNFIRTPRERWYDLTSTPGSLTIRARAVDLGSRDQPSFIGRRQQHAFATSSAAMRYEPVHPGDKAGLVAFHNESYYFFLGVTIADGGRVVQLVEHAGAATPAGGLVLASAPVQVSQSSPILLKIVARGGRYDFYYATRPDRWVLLRGDVDGTILSTKVAGGFVGTYFGMHAYGGTP